MDRGAARSAICSVNFIVVTDTIVERQVGTDLPGVLCEKRHRLVADTADGISESLNEVCWESRVRIAGLA